MKNRKLIGAIAVVCALGGVTAGVAQSATSKHTRHVRNSTQAPSGKPGAGGPMGGPGARGGPGGPGGVHSVSVQPNKAGTAFVTVTTDSGTVKSVDASAGTITIVEGTKTLTYATPTITVPSGATVTLDGKSSSLSSLLAEDHVTVSSSSEGTTVFATDSSFHPEGGPGQGGPPPSGA